jgi:AcrR family transcriptional regulator
MTATAARLLLAAAQLFRRQGFAATTTRDIAAAADMQSGSPFYHFKSKDALLYAVMEEGMRRALARQQRGRAGTQAGYLHPRAPNCAFWCRCIWTCCWARATTLCQ